MKRFVLRRLAEMGVALLLMSALIFLLSRLTGDPLALLLSDYSTEEDRSRLTSELGLDRPLLEQFAIFVGNALVGDLGNSVIGDKRAALTLVAERLPASLQLAGVALFLALVLGLPLGVAAAVRRGSWVDSAARVLALLGQSIPVFWLGLVFIYVFSVQLRWLPSSGYGSAAHFVLPAAAMSLFTVSAITRLVRTSMIDALQAEYIKLARIKGASERVVVWKHALRNSLIPVLTFMGAFFGTMITGAVVIETVFAWPGIGRLAYDAILNRDFPVIQAVVLTATVIFILANLAVDLAYALFDPRIRLASG
jgi:peptide/nickel transport system permease protein